MYLLITKPLLVSLPQMTYQIVTFMVTFLLPSGNQQGVSIALVNSMKPLLTRVCISLTPSYWHTSITSSPATLSSKQLATTSLRNSQNSVIYFRRPSPLLFSTSSAQSRTESVTMRASTGLKLSMTRAKSHKKINT